jgi:hypothetical protein
MEGGSSACSSTLGLKRHVLTLQKGGIRGRTIRESARSAVLSLGILQPQRTAGTERDSRLSCSTFPAELSESDLVARYGQENVITAPVTGADDLAFEGTVLFPKLDDTRVEIAWYDVKTKQNAMWIRIQGQRSRWRLPNGIALGGDLLGMERRNGFPFHLSRAFRSKGRGPYGLGPEGASRTWMPNGAVSGSRSSQTGTEQTIRS